MTSREHTVATANFEGELAGILEAIKCLVDGTRVLYVSVPITGGHRFIDWYAKRGRTLGGESSAYAEALRAEVIEPNCEAGRAMATALRRESGRVVVDPTRFFLDHWSQPHYHELWCEVVRRYVAEVHFAEDWWLSVGCALEFITAVEHHRATFQGTDTPLSAAKGYALLEEGIRELDRVGAPSEKLRSVVRQLGPSVLQRSGA